MKGRGAIAIILILTSFLLNCNSNKKDKLPPDCRIKLPLTFNKFSPKTQVWLDSTFTEALTKQKFNGVFAFYYNDSLFSGSLGLCAPNEKCPPSMLDMFQLASLSKPFTSMVTMQLMSEKKLKLSDSIQKYFPNFRHKNITIKQLLTHTSGLPEYHMYIESKEYPADSLLSNEAVYARIDADTQKLYFKPGTEFDYCNTNFAMLARLIVKIENKTWEKILEERIFKKIGMDSTHFYNAKKRKTEDYKVKGLYGRNNYYKEYLINEVPGDKGIYSTANDLLKLHLALNQYCLLDTATKKLMFTPQVPYERGRYHYGLGWRMALVNGHWWAFHTGWWKGFRTYFWHALDFNACFILLSNHASYGKVDCLKIASTFKS